MRAWVLLVGLATGCGRWGFDATGDAAGGALDGSGSDGAIDAPADVAITAGTRSFGTTTVGPSSQNTSQNRVWLSRFMLTEPGMLQRLVAYVGVGGGSGTGSNLRGIVYADAAGMPGALVAQTQPVALGGQTSDAWTPLVLASPVSLAAGAYWIGIHTESSLQIAYQASMGATKNDSDTYADGPATTYAGGAQTFTMTLSIYAEYMP